MKQPPNIPYAFDICEVTFKTCQYSGEIFDLIPSTNTYAKENDPPDLPFLILARRQTQGRGRGSHSWDSGKANANLISTWVYELAQTPTPVLSIRLGLAVFRSLLLTWPYLDLSLKAPNDIFLNGKKLSGLLAEMVQFGKSHRLIFGLAINVFSKPEDPSVNSVTICLADVLSTAELNQRSWSEFIYRLKTELDFCQERSHLELDQSETNALVFALNKRLPEGEKVLSIDPNGSMKTQKGLIHWTEL